MIVNYQNLRDLARCRRLPYMLRHDAGLRGYTPILHGVGPRAVSPKGRYYLLGQGLSPFQRYVNLPIKLTKEIDKELVVKPSSSRVVVNPSNAADTQLPNAVSLHINLCSIFGFQLLFTRRFSYANLSNENVLAVIALPANIVKTKCGDIRGAP